MTELNNITEGSNLENEEEDIQRNNILNINKRLIEKEESSSTKQLKETEFFIQVQKEKNYFKNEKTGLIEIFPEVGYIKEPVLYDIS